MTPPAPVEGRRRRWPLFLLLGVVVALIAAAAAFVSMRRELARSVIQSQLHALGLSDESHEVADFGFGGLTVRNVRVGADDLLADEVVFSYSFANLRAGILDGVRIRGLRVRGDLSDQGFTLGALDALRTSEDDATTDAPGPFALPIREIVVEDFAFRVGSADGDYALAGALGVRSAKDGDVDVDLRVAGTLPQLGSEHPISVAGSASLRDARIDVDLTVQDSEERVVATVVGHHDLASGSAVVTARNVRIGADDVVVEEVHGTLTEASLRAGILDAVRIRGLRVRGGLSDQGLTLGALDALVTSGDDAEPVEPGPIALPIRELVVEDFELALATEAGSIDAAGSLAARSQPDGAVGFEFAVSGTHPDLGPDQPVEAAGSGTVRAGWISE